MKASALGIAFLPILLLMAQETGPRILAPAPDATVSPGMVRIIAQTAQGKLELLVDGKPVSSAVSPAPGVSWAEVSVAAGLHEIKARSASGERTIRIAAGAAAQPYRQHPPAGLATCEACHAVKNGVWAMKRITLAPLCGQCHDRGQFAQAHTHNADILSDCQTCHLPHGSAAGKHLAREKATVCKQCHS